MYKTLFKTLLDFALALIGLVLLLPVFIVVWIMLLFANKGKVFFLQVRPGKNERLFRVVKFKTMNDRKDGDGKRLPDTLHLSPFGQFLRKTSLDEIPQLINVLKGDMSLVGPRPLLPEYLPLYNERQSRRHEVKPGITGWAQVKGRNAISWPEKLERDVEYVDRQSFSLDMYILWLTLMELFRLHGRNAEQTQLAEPFRGEE